MPELVREGRQDSAMFLSVISSGLFLRLFSWPFLFGLEVRYCKASVLGHGSMCLYLDIARLQPWVMDPSVYI